MTCSYNCTEKHFVRTPDELYICIIITRDKLNLRYKRFEGDYDNPPKSF